VQIFVYEFFSGGGLWSLQRFADPASALLREGAAMAEAIATDFACLAGVRVVLLRDARLSRWKLAGCVVHDVADRDEEQRQFSRFSGQSDWTIVIAPEFDSILLQRCQSVEVNGGRLLGPRPHLVELASDKQSTAEFLAAAGIKTPRPLPCPSPTQTFDESALPAVMKPRFGAGSFGIRLLRRLQDFPETADERWRLERWCPGQPASISWIGNGALLRPLEPCFQRIAQDGSFRYLGGSAPLPKDLRRRVLRLAAHVAARLPNALGYLGMDVILSDSHARDDVVVEINPRLTTSYLGLREIAQTNLAGAMLAAAEGRACELRFSGERIEFGTGNRVQLDTT
jgi:predicted ATP-grasp superfamily ATP-dependent carboligase